MGTSDTVAKKTTTASIPANGVLRPYLHEKSGRRYTYSDVKASEYGYVIISIPRQPFVGTYTCNKSVGASRSYSSQSIIKRLGACTPSSVMAVGYPGGYNPHTTGPNRSRSFGHYHRIDASAIQQPRRLRGALVHSCRIARVLGCRGRCG
jgi:hypothetical protein